MSALGRKLTFQFSENPDASATIVRARPSPMLLAQREDECVMGGGGAEDLVGHAQSLLADNRSLLASLNEKQAVAAALAFRLGRLTEELRRQSNTLLVEAQKVAANAKSEPALCPAVLTVCSASGRLRPSDGHEGVVKESLARIAAQLAGRHPDTRVKVELAGQVAFDGHAWRYPDFIDRAERAFSKLAP